MPGISGRGWAVAGLAAVTGVTAFAVLAHVYLGSFARFMADTYCHAELAFQQGALGSMLYHYRTVSGRFSANFVDNGLSAFLGPGYPRWWSPLLLCAWLLALAGVVSGLSQGVAARYRRWLAILVPLLIVYVTLDNTPLVGQSVYWSTGTNNYLVPLVLFTFFAALMARRAQRPLRGLTGGLWLGVSLLLNAFICGFSETVMVVVSSTLAVAVILVWFFGAAELKRHVLPLLVAGLIGAVGGMLVVAAAPGNKVRQASAGATPDLMTLAFNVLTFTKQVVLDTVAREPLNVLGLPIVMALAGANLARPDGWLFGSTQALTRTVLFTPLITLALVTASVVPAAYTTSNLPNYRNMLVVMYVLTVGLGLWGYAVGQWYRHLQVEALQSPLEQRALALGLAVVVVAFTITTLRTAQVTFVERAVYVNYARLWDQNEAMILAARQAGAPAVTIFPLSNPFGIEEAKPDPNDWVNYCLNVYYGLTISAAAP